MNSKVFCTAEEARKFCAALRTKGYWSFRERVYSEAAETPRAILAQYRLVYWSYC